MPRTTGRPLTHIQRAFFDASHLAAGADAKGLVWMGGDVATSIQLAGVRRLGLFIYLYRFNN